MSDRFAFEWYAVNFEKQIKHTCTPPTKKTVLPRVDPYVAIISTSRCQKTPVCKSSK